METNSIILNDLEEILPSNIPWTKLENKTVLITGANGFLASYIVKAILHKNRDTAQAPTKVLGLVRNLAKAQERFKDYHLDRNLSLIEHPITEKLRIDEEVHFVIHAASQASPKYYGVDPVGTIEANTIGTYNLLDFSKNKSIESFLYFSSGEVYGIVDDSKIPTREEDYGYIDPTLVRSCYAESKRLGENLCVSFYHQFGVPSKIVRPFHTYGPGMDLADGRVFADFVANVVRRESITLNSDGSARRAFCYIKDATIGFLKLLLEGENGRAYNLGNPNEEYSVLELANAIVKIKPEYNLTVNMNTAYKESNSYLKSVISRNSPNIEKIKELGWEPTTRVPEGFKRTIESYL